MLPLIEIWLRGIVGFVCLSILAFAAWRQFRGGTDQHDPFDSGLD